MDYVIRLAMELHAGYLLDNPSIGSWENQAPGGRSVEIIQAKRALAAIAATGCKVVEREPTPAMMDNTFLPVGDWQDMFDAAPEYPGA